MDRNIMYGLINNNNSDGYGRNKLQHLQKNVSFRRVKLLILHIYTFGIYWVLQDILATLIFYLRHILVVLWEYVV